MADRLGLSGPSGPPFQLRVFLLCVAAAGLVALPSLFSRSLPVMGQTAGPIATRPVPIIAGPDTGPNNSGNAIPPQASGPGPARTVAGGAPAASPSSLSTGEATPVAASPVELNLTPTDGVSLVAGDSLLYVPPESVSCPATAQLAYIDDQAVFSARCGSGGPLALADSALLCMQPGGVILASALGNLENLSVTGDQALTSHVSPTGVLVCTSIPGPGTYTLSVTEKEPAPPALHALPKSASVRLPAVGLGGISR